MGIQLFKAKYEVDECLDQIRECMEIGWTGIGFKTIEFENAWSDFSGMPNAHFLNSSTMGLNLSVDILKEKYGWKDGDEIITTPITFISTNHAIIKSGLKAVFADIDDSICLDPKSVREHITDRTRAVMYVGLGGNVGNYDEIVNICRQNGLALILDAAHMAGTRLNNRIPGMEADVVVYSFQAVKNLPTADSGMICFQDKELDTIARKKSWLGINKDTYARTNDGGTYNWAYDVEYIGEKGHGNSVVASIGLVQLKYLDRDNDYRRKLCDLYREKLATSDKVRFVRIEKGCESSCHLFQIIVDDRNGLMEYLKKREIFPGVHYMTNTNYRMYEYAKNTCKYADYISDHILSLPLHLHLSTDDVEYVCSAVLDYLG